MRKLLAACVLALPCVVPSVVNAAYYHVEQPGLIQAAFPLYSTATSIVMMPGYGECGGSYWEISPSDPLTSTGYTLSGLTTSTNGYLSYIYVSGSSSFPSVTLTNSSTTPTWNNSKMGWYNGGDRCIGVVFITPGAAVAPFDINPDGEMICCPAQLVTNGAVSLTYPSTLGAMNFVDASSYIPVNAVAARIGIYVNPSTSTWCEIHIFSGDSLYSTEPYNTELGSAGAKKAQANGWIPLGRNSTRTFYWYAWSSVNNNSSQIWLHGFRIRR